MTLATDNIPVGSKLVVSFAILGQRTGMTTVKGTVCWKGNSYSHQCPGLGIELDDFNPDVQAFVAR